VDATFLEQSWRQALRALARRCNAPFVLLACTADPATLRERLARRSARGDDAAEADAAVLERQLQGYTPPAPEENPLDAGAGDSEALTEAILARLQRRTPTVSIP